MNLHSGNVLVNSSSNKIRLVDFEGFYFNYSIKNEQHYFYIIELFLEEFYSQNHDKHSAMLSDIFNQKFNVFEIIDIVSFGRIIYEMYTGKELKAPYPDEFEYSEMNEEIKDILKSIFPNKVKITNKGKINYIGYPEINISDLLKFSFFAEDDVKSKDKKSSNNSQGMKKKEEDKNSIDSEMKFEFDNLAYIKEEIFHQQKFINSQFTKIKNQK